MLRGDQDCEFRKPRWHAGLVAAMGAELLRQLAERGRVQIAEKRAAHLELATRSGANRIDQLMLLGRERLLGDRGEAGRLRLLGGHRRPRLDCSMPGRAHVNSNDLMMIGTTFVTSIVRPIST